MKHFAYLLLAVTLTAQGIGVAMAQSQGVVVKQSAFSVAETIERMEKILVEKGFQVFARIDHAARAQDIEKTLPPAQVLIYGNPRIATPLMQGNPVAGLDLPMRALAYRDTEGKVFLVYDHPAYIARRHGMDPGSNLVKAISRILTRLTDSVVKNL